MQGFISGGVDIVGEVGGDQHNDSFDCFCLVGTRFVFICLALKNVE